MSIALHGTGVARGIAIGKAHILVRDQLEISEYCVAREFVEDEVRRLEGTAVLEGLALSLLPENLVDHAASGSTARRTHAVSSREA